MPLQSTLNSSMASFLELAHEYPIKMAVVFAAIYTLFKLFDMLVVQPWTCPMYALPGPPKIGKVFDLRHLEDIMLPMNSYIKLEEYVRNYGKNIRVQGIGYWDQRFLTFDSRAIRHILVNAFESYPKPWQTRRFLASFLDEGLTITEGAQHRRQRKVINPAFAPQVLRQMHGIFHAKAEELRDRWTGIVGAQETEIDAHHWVARATFDAFALAGFDFKLDIIQNEDNELYQAYKNMFDILTQEHNPLRDVFEIYFPWIKVVFPTKLNKETKRCRAIIEKAGQEMLNAKKAAILHGQGVSEKDYEAYPIRPTSDKDMFTLMVKSNLAEASRDRLPDSEILAQIHSMLSVGSDSVGLAITWTLHHLALNQDVQTRLREELLPYAPFSSDPSLDIDSATTFPYLDAVVKETLRFMPPVHSTIRAADKDDIIPTEDGVGIKIRKGTFIHLPLEAMNLDKNVWGQDAWEYKPERWSNLPEAARRQGGLLAGLMTFSVGPHSCPGSRFAIVEIKSFIATLITSFVLAPAPDKVIAKFNTLATRPWVKGEWKKGSQLPLVVKPFVPQS